MFTFVNSKKSQRVLCEGVGTLLLPFVVKKHHVTFKLVPKFMLFEESAN